jgi:YEATS family
MSDWAPFLQALVWPAFLGIVLFQAKRPLGQLLTAVQERIIAGAEFEAGTSGIRVGAAPKLAEAPAPPPSKSADAKAPTDELRPSDIYLVHTARRDKSLDPGDRPYYRIRLYLDADDEAMLDRVSEVTYYLHPTFNDPIRVVNDRETAFEVRTRIWGEFNAAAIVRFKDGSDRKLERYLNI